MKSNLIPILDRNAVSEFLPKLKTRDVLWNMFSDLAEGLAVQPSQTLTLFPNNSGDFISYAGVMSSGQSFGVKLSPYIPTEGRPIVTAWTMLMSMQTGEPLLLCDSGLLTIERTAATTAIAVELLAPEQSECLAVIGLGAVGLAHLRHVLTLHGWKEIRVFAADVATWTEQRISEVKAMDSRIRFANSAEEAIQNADVVMLCTSSAKPVIPFDHLKSTCLVTSISTNAPRAHEISPHALPLMDVYCDYKETTPSSAGEMQIAAEMHQWSKSQILGDLPGLVSGRDRRPSFDKPVFFRSIGLGLEDVAIAYALHQEIVAN
ncbi:ornithine cyclodeaminase family protein [Leeia sp. TBRC 13508]|uniref:Ornithine cyclodeaminase family protein n=1 Tax=Leeia speluncae TaxID=2884804 RepID=A0ABS8DA74_9NEIS|nr:ornithine cyclodeaminase family protein [Leeia speluncae]MCB6185105.1 ornithine cyclodeaminase family protein [Leeia speluncae]